MYVNENNSNLTDRHLNTCIMWYFWIFRQSTMCMRRACMVLWVGTCGRCYLSVSLGRTTCGPITRSWWTSGPRRRSGPCVQWTKVWTFHKSTGINRMSLSLKSYIRMSITLKPITVRTNKKFVSTFLPKLESYHIYAYLQTTLQNLCIEIYLNTHSHHMNTISQNLFSSWSSCTGFLSRNCMKDTDWLLTYFIFLFKQLKVWPRIHL